MTTNMKSRHLAITLITILALGLAGGANANWEKNKHGVWATLALDGPISMGMYVLPQYNCEFMVTMAWGDGFALDEEHYDATPVPVRIDDGELIVIENAVASTTDGYHRIAFALTLEMYEQMKAGLLLRVKLDTKDKPTYATFSLKGFTHAATRAYSACA